MLKVRKAKKTTTSNMKTNTHPDRDRHPPQNESFGATKLTQQTPATNCTGSGSGQVRFMSRIMFRYSGFDGPDSSWPRETRHSMCRMALGLVKHVILLPDGTLLRKSRYAS